MLLVFGNRARDLKLLLLAACLVPAPMGQDAAAAQSEAEGSYLRAADHRIGEIAYRLAVRGARFCPAPHPLTGLLFHHLDEYERDDRAVMVERHGLDRGLGVLSVIAGSPAAEAGLRAGDVILTVNGQPIRSDSTFAPPRATPRRAVLDFARSDDEVAVIVAHELAHNILAHPAHLEEQNVPRGLLRGFGANAAKVRATEEEADRLGISLVWAAGFDASAAIPFWRRFYERFDGPQLFRTHPTLEGRERIIAETIGALDASAQRPELGKGTLADR